MDNQPGIKCRECKALVYEFNQLAIYTTDNQVLVKPQVASARNPRVYKRLVEASESEYSVKTIYCSNCNGKVGKVVSDGISETFRDTISCKYVCLDLPDGSRVERKMWTQLTQELQSLRIEKLSCSDLVRQAGGQSYSREGLTEYDTTFVDMSPGVTSKQTLLDLTITKMRDYQVASRLYVCPSSGLKVEMVDFALRQNSLVCLPTGSGKTLVAAAVLKAMLQINPKKVAAFVVNKNHLAWQQCQALEAEVPNAKIVTMYGQKDPEEKRYSIKVIARFNYDILVGTCECISHLIDASTVRIEDLCCLVMDEAHEAKKNSPYARLIEKVRNQDIRESARPLLLGLSASPLATVNLKISKEKMTQDLLNFASSIGCMPGYPRQNDPYQNGIEHTKDIAYVCPRQQDEKDFKRKLDEYLEKVVFSVKDRLSAAASSFQELASHINSNDNSCDTNCFRSTLRKIEMELDSERDKATKSTQLDLVYEGYAIRDHLNQILAVHEINNIIGHEAAAEQMLKIFQRIEKPSKGQETRKKRILYNFSPDFSGEPLHGSFMKKLKYSCSPSGPSLMKLSSKCNKVIDLVKEHYQEHKEASRVLLFVDMRRTARRLQACLASIKDMRRRFNPQYIVGRGLSGDGLTVEEQQEILKDFSEGRIRLLVSTSVLEEGLDVPSCNLVLRLEAPRDLKEFIQSRGRAGRSRNGKFYIICKSELEKEQQQKFLDHMQRQASIIKMIMGENEYNHLGRLPASRLLKAVDLKSPNLRSWVQKEASSEVKADDPDDEQLKLIADLMARDDLEAEQYLYSDEYDPTEVRIDIKLALFVSTEEEFLSDKAHVKDILTAICYPEVIVTEVEDSKLPVKTILGTKYFPELTLTQDSAQHEYDQMRVEKELIESFTSRAFEKVDVWMMIKTQQLYFPRSTSLRISLHKTSIGSFLTPREFVKRMDIGSASNLRMDRSTDLIRITVNDNLKIEGSFDHLQNFAVVDLIEGPSTGGRLMVLYLTFSLPPRLLEVQGSEEDDGLNSTRVFEYGGSESRLAFSTCLTYRLEIPNPVRSIDSQAIDVRAKQFLKLLDAKGVSVYYAKISTNTSSRQPEEIECLSQELCPNHFGNKEVDYALQCMRSAPGFVAERVKPTFYQVLNQVDEALAKDALYGLARTLCKTIFCDMTIQLLAEIRDPRRRRTELKTDASHDYIKRIVVTPTSIRFYEPDLMQTNRIVRERAAGSFIRVHLRDEDSNMLSTLFGNLDRVVDRIYSLMMDGIKIGDKTYRYLASSNSQMRNHSCYFIEDDDGTVAESIRSRIGDLSGITNVAQYVSRIGLAFSTSTRTIRIPNYTIIPDITTPDGAYTFSDGVGMISRSRAEKVKEKLKLTFLPSAFQIRLGGSKGMVSVWDDEFLYARFPADLQVRKSMYKYDSKYKDLEVLEHSRPLPLHLNQQVIMLLSNVGVPDEVFMHLMTKVIVSVRRMFVNEDDAIDQLKRFMAEEVKNLQSVRFSFPTDPFFRHVMVAIYKQQMRDLRERSRVRLSLDSGRVLIGVLDETMTLEYGEVFIQISKKIENPSTETEIIARDIVIMKNPCLHPGDVRVFKGRDIPELRHLVDCVVFSAKGHRPNPNELSGSDLDGDQYHCIWDPKLLPPLEIKDPMDYSAAKKVEEKEAIKARKMIEHTCEYIKHDTLGVIDNTHKALADQKGIESDTCLKLAEIHALAVDAPKTGKWQSVPREIKRELRVYPDYMLKKDKPSYPSEHVLGKMFRECNKYLDAAGGPHLKDYMSKPDRAFKYRGYDDYVEDAIVTFKAYNSEILSIMKMYGIQTEAEVVSKAITGVYSRLMDELEDIRENVKILIKHIKEKYRRIFEEDGNLGRDGCDRKTEEKRKASAWYYVTYRSESGETYKVDNEERRFLSFPWLVSDILASIYHENFLNSDQLHHRSLDSTVSDSIKEIFDSLANELEDHYQHHLNLCRAIDREIDYFARCQVFGASALRLYNEQSGDVSALVTRVPYSEYSSHEDCIHLLDGIKYEKRTFFFKSDIDAARIHMRVKINKRMPKNRADLTADVWSFYHWVTIKVYMFKYPWLFPVLKLLYVWTSTVGLIGSRASFLSEYLVPLLFIDHCLKQSAIAAIPTRPQYDKARAFVRDPTAESPFGTVQDWKRLVGRLMQSQKGEQTWEGAPGVAGRQLQSFMESGPTLLNSNIHPDLRQVIDAHSWTETESAKNLKLLSNEMEKASQRLCIHVNAAVLLTRLAVEKNFVLGIEASKKYAGDEEALTRMLHSRSGARVDIHTKMNARDPGMIVRGAGTEVELSLLGDLVDFLNHQCTEEIKSRRLIRVKGFKDISGAHSLLIEGANSESDLIKLEPYVGMKHPHHETKSLFVIRQLDVPPDQSIDPTDTDVYTQFLVHFKQQMHHFRTQQWDSVHGTPEFQIKFGRTYVVSPPKSFQEHHYPLTVGELNKTMERQKTRVVDTMFDVCNRLPRNRGTGRSEGNLSTSFVSSVVFDSDILEKLRPMISELAGSDDKGVKIVAQTGTGAVTVRYDHMLGMKGIETSPIRWIVSDIKRAPRSDDVDAIDGNECDIRFMLKTQFPVTDEGEDVVEKTMFQEALGRDGKELFLKNSDLDVEFMEEYEAKSYRILDETLKMDVKLFAKKTIQYTHRISKGRFSRKRQVVEVRIEPPLNAINDPGTVDTALDVIWKLAFKFSDLFKCKTSE